MSKTLLAIGFSALLVGASYAAPARDSDKSAAAFRGDERLEKKITLARKDLPVGDLLAEVGKQLKVRLVASKDTADDKVTLFSDDKPAVESLLQIARTLDFRWFRSNGGYELDQDAESKTREAELRAAAVNEQKAAIQRRMEGVAAALKMPADKLNARIAELQQLLVGNNAPQDQRAMLTEELSTLRDASRPGAAVAVQVYGSLSPAQLAQLWSGDPVTLSSERKTLAEGTAQRIEDAAEQQVANFQVKTLSIGGGPPPGNENLPLMGAEVTLSVTQNGPLRIASSPGGERKLQLQVTLSAIHGTAQQRRVKPILWSPIVMQRPAPDPEQKEVTDPELKQEVELDLGRSEAQPGPAADLARIRALPAAPSAYGFAAPVGWKRLSEVLEQLHKSTHLRFVADSYVRARVDPDRTSTPVGQKRPLYGILNQIAGTLNYEWSKEGDVITLRSRIFYEDRPREVPTRVINPWRERVVRAGAASLDDLADLAARVTDPQADGMEQFWAWYVNDARIPPMSGVDGFYANREHLRLWAALLPNQRRSAQGGSILPATQLSPLQRPLFTRAVLSTRHSMQMPSQQADDPTAADIASGGFSLSSTEMQQQQFSGLTADGQRAGIIIQGINPAGRVGGAAPPKPQLADGLELKAVGKPKLLDRIQFNYHLAGSQTPSRRASVTIPRPEPKAPAQ